MLDQLPLWCDAEVLVVLRSSAQGCAELSPLYLGKDADDAEVPGPALEVPRRLVQLGPLIGAGAFGRVHLARLQLAAGSALVAAKMLSETATADEQRDFEREIATLRRCGAHPHVVRLVAWCAAPPLALLEHAPRGDLLTLLRKSRRVMEGREEGSDEVIDQGVGERVSEADTEYTTLSSESDPPASPPPTPLKPGAVSTPPHYVSEPALRLDSDVMRDYALQVAKGMQHLESKGITHRDLAARNVLVDAAGTLKVADLGLSRTGVYVHTRARPVPLRWLAPEAILECRYSSRSDVWAYAVLLWEIATLGGLPYAELSNHEVPPFLTAGRRLARPARASPRLHELMTECWREDPAQRPSFTHIVDRLQAQQQLYIDLDSVFLTEKECDR